jgi:hypothetical protein
VGIFSFFRNRRMSESALASPEQQAAIEQAMAQAEAWQASAGAQTQASYTQVEGVGGLSGLGALISQLHAAQQAGVTLESGNQVIDMRGSGMREEILGVIAAHGIDASKPGEVDGSSADGLQQEILAVLARNGIDVNQAAMGMPFAIVDEKSKEPAEPIDPTVPQIRNPLDR